MRTSSAGALEGATVSEAFGEITLDVQPADVPAALRGASEAGYDFLIDLAATDHLGFGGAVAGYWSAPAGTAAGGQDMNLVGSAGLAVVPQPLGPRRFAVSYQLLARGLEPPQRLRVRTWLDDGRACRARFPSSRPPTTSSARRSTSWASRSTVTRTSRASSCPEGWDGHPHRKDYPIGGEPVQFSDAV